MNFRLPIRYKMLLVIFVVLLSSMGAYLYLAVSLFNEDKLAYVYDLNSSLVDSFSEQTRSNLNVMRDKLSLFVRDVLRPDLPFEERNAIAANLFEKDRDILRVEIYRSDPGSGEFQKDQTFLNTAVANEKGFDDGALLQLRTARPLPFTAIADTVDDLYLQNSSLPPDLALLTVAIPYRTEAGSLVVAADFAFDRLLGTFGKSKLHETYLVDETGEVIAHPDASKVIAHVDMAKQALVAEALGAELARGVSEFKGADGSAMLGAYAKVEVGRLSVITQIPKREALRASGELTRRSIIFAVGILLIAFMVSIVFSRFLTAPIRGLSAAAEEIGQGRYDVAINVKSRDEIGDLARTFEAMSGEIRETQSQLVFSEKMAAFGQLGAGITHEVKNPITGIVGFAQLAQMQIDNKDKLTESLQMIEKEGKRCSDILVNFLKFVRQDADEVVELNLNVVVEEVGKIINHQLMINNVKLTFKLGEAVPSVLANAAKLQQVLLNLAINAQQAMPDGGKVIISTKVDSKGRAIITVADNGPGIPEDIRENIFDPFFTTKPPGEGTGLGLSIVFRIIKDFGGVITVKSEMGKGTVFAIRLNQA